MCTSLIFLILLVLFGGILFNTIQCTPIDLDDLMNCRIAPHQCPNKNVKFFLYTRETQENPTQLDISNEETILKANYATDRPFIVLLHGYTGHKDFSPNTEIRPALFQNNEFNVISVDYHPLAPEPCYIQAVQNLPVVANCTAQLLDFMINQKIFSLNKLHIIGFSLGGQTSGMISHYFKSGIIPHITGLDPAKPLFIFANEEHKLTKMDADFVDVIHTDVLARGVLRTAGHSDFYVNGGIEQPGCAFQTNTSTGTCNHARAPQYYAESIISDTGFWGFKCKNYRDWAFRRCTAANSEELAIMGWKANKKSQGVFFLNTNKDPPYAKGILPEFTLSDNGTESTTEPMTTENAAADV